MFPGFSNLGTGFLHHLWSRCPALGWPFTMSQEERLSHCFGSPLTQVGCEISLVEVCLARSTSLSSSRLVGESLLGLGGGGGGEGVEGFGVAFGVAGLLWVGLLPQARKNACLEASAHP